MSKNDTESHPEEKQERKISIPDSISQKKDSDNITVKEIYSVIESYFPNNQFDEFLLNYISNMIYLDHPENENDLKALVGDYLEDKLIYPEDKKEEICSKIYKQIYKDKVKTTRRAIIAEKLKEPIKLSDIAVGSKNKINSINFDANALTFHVDKLYTDSVTGLEQKKNLLQIKIKLKR